MLIDTSIAVAYKCPSCGGFKFLNTYFFEIQHEKYFFRCDCGKSELTINGNNSRCFNVTAPCIGCGDGHTFALGRNRLLDGKTHVYRCPKTGIEYLFIGKDYAVRRQVDNLQDKLDRIIDLFGYESYFKNTQVMFDSLNKIHDLAEKGNLCCECGSGDIELNLFSDRIYLKCRKCSADIIIPAISNENLKDITEKQQILLYKEMK